MMRPLLLAAAMTLAATAGASSFAAPPKKAAAARDWTKTVVLTLDGGYRVGNPAAAVKLVEYVSLTCPHCRQFAATGGPALVGDHVRSGRVSFEIRPYPLDIVAAVGAQLNRCAAPAQAFALNDAILASQEEWFARLDAVSAEEIAAIEALPAAQQRVRIAAATGIDAIAARHGVSPERTRACLADDAGAARIEAIKAAAEAIGIQGTPSFTINGQIAQHVHDWASLEPLLRQR